LKSDCLNLAKQKLLVTGCGRSGTTYMAKFLEKSGYDIHHESAGTEGCVSWPMIVNYYSPWTQPNEDSFDHIFHQVRHPLDVITSWYENLKNLDRGEWNFIRKHLSQIDRSDSLIVHCAKYWYYWNLLAEEHAEWRYRIEDFESILPEFAIRSGLRLNAAILAEVPKNYNSWKNISYKISWQQLKAELPQSLYDNIINMSIRYGYYSNLN
jgi:hypothetical protein